jgi:hypothetical protein
MPQPPKYRKVEWGRDSYYNICPSLYGHPFFDGQEVKVQWPNGRKQSVKVKVVLDNGMGRVRLYVPVIVHGQWGLFEITEDSNVEFLR